VPEQRRKVYIVLVDTHTAWEIAGVYSTREKAEAFVGNGSCPAGKFQWIEEQEIDPEVPKSLEDYR
jgi:hypothetical protein